MSRDTNATNPNIGKFNLSSIATVKSYNYSKLVISYGGLQRQTTAQGRAQDLNPQNLPLAHGPATATFQWNSITKSFVILFGKSLVYRLSLLITFTFYHFVLADFIVSLPVVSSEKTGSCISSTGVSFSYGVEG